MQQADGGLETLCQGHAACLTPAARDAGLRSHGY